MLYPILWGKAFAGISKLEFNEFLMWLIAFCTLWSIDEAIMITEDFLSARVYGSVIEDIRKDIYKKILNLPVKAFDENKNGELINRVSESTQTVVSAVKSLFRVFMRTIREIFIIIFIFLISFEVGILYIIIGICVYMLFNKYGMKIKRITKSMRKDSDKYVSELQQSIQGIRELKSNGLKTKQMIKFNSIVKVLKKKDVKSSDISTTFWALVGLIRMFSNFLILILVGYLVFIGRITLEYFIAMHNYSQRIFETIRMLAEVGVDIQKVSVALERIFEILDNKLYEDEVFGERDIEKVEGGIEFRNVEFSYNEESKILKGIDIKMPRNSKFAIVGKSGSGKSTLFNLLLRFYKLEKGNILIDGINIEEFNEKSLRNHIAIIRQDPFLFNKTIKENLLMVKENATEDEIHETCKLAYIHDYIMTLPKKYDTLIGEGGVNLSGGQKQRIAIARALLKRSKILLFDEATSALDNESQQYIKDAINEIAKNHTIIIIAHRLSTVIDCDQMILMDDGKIVATGTHDELIKNSKIYGKLYNVDLLNA